MHSAWLDSEKALSTEEPTTFDRPRSRARIPTTVFGRRIGLDELESPLPTHSNGNRVPRNSSRFAYEARCHAQHERYSSMDTVVEVISNSSPSATLYERSFERESIRDGTIAMKGKSRGLPYPDITTQIKDLIGVSSYEYERYDRGRITEKHFWDEYIIDPLETGYTREKAPTNWQYYVHPDGGLYFYHRSTGGNAWSIPILTDIYIYNSDARQRLERVIGEISNFIKKYDISMPSEDVALVLEFRQSGRCGYYFVDHKTKCLFWLEHYDAMEFLAQVRVRYTPSMIGNEMKSLYWLHNEYFPHVRSFPKEAAVELRDILIHAIGDSLTSPQNTSPYGLDVLQKMLALVNDIRKSDEKGVGSSTVIYRFLHNFYHERLLHLHGEECARLDVDRSIHPERKRTFLISLFSPFLLFGPSVHLRKLHEMSVDSLVRKRDWAALQQELTNEWKEIILYATVLLNANVAYLAIQSVDESAPLGSRSPQQRASYFSIANSIGAIVLGLLLVRQHTTSLTSEFLAHRSASVWGLETLALMYSLPYALLMWGMVSFLIAFSIMCFGSGDVLTILMMSVTCFTLCILLLWCISASYEKRPFWYPWIMRKLSPKHTEGVLAGKGRLRSSSPPKVVTEEYSKV